MSLENKGSMVTTITVSRDPDRSGNFVCDGTDTELQNAIDYLDALNAPATIRLKSGTYTLTSLSIDTPLKMLGEEGVIFNLNAKPCLTITAAATTVVFENINLTSTLDGLGHGLLQADTTFRNCEFTPQIDTGATLNGFLRADAASIDVNIIECTLDAGKEGAEYFTLLDVNNDINNLLVDRFLIEDIICNGTVGRISVFNVTTDNTVVFARFENIVIEHVDTTFQGSTFLRTAADIDTLIYDHFIFMDATYTEDSSYFSPVTNFISVGNVKIDDMSLFARSHPVINADILEVNNHIQVGDGSIHCSFDLGVESTYPASAMFTNCRFFNVSLDMNTGWGTLQMNNSHFRGSRIYIIDEGDPTGTEKRVTIDNCIWHRTEDSFRTGGITIAFGQGVNLPKLQVSNTTFYIPDGGTITPIEVGGAIGYPTHFIFENVIVGPDAGFSQPRFISGARSSDDHVIWIFDSEIATYFPPLHDWNPIRPNDRFDNVKWIDTEDSAVTYSENEGVATIPNAAATVDVTHNLVVTPTWVLLTGGHAETTQLYATALGAATFTATTAIGVTSDDRLIYWRASITR